MKIGIDGNEANVEVKVGIGEYAFELLKQFKKYQVSGIKYQVYLKDNPRKELPKEDQNWKYRIVYPKRLWTQIGLPVDLYVHHPRPDVFFSPTHYAPRFSSIPSVISIMDLSYIYYPELFQKKDLYQLQNWTKYSAKNAKRILTISQASKDDIIKIYNIPETRVVVTYPGIKMDSNANAMSLKDLQIKYNLYKEYILFVGTLQPRKNIIRLIEAYSKVVGSSKKSPYLVLVGKRGWLFEDILNAPQKYGVSENVKFLEFVSDEELVSLYKYALFFILPSLYEGFGLPVLEAMLHGCPVITSNVSSLPEAGGDAALYIDPLKVDDIAEKMDLLLKNEKKREELRKKGYQHIKKFSWEKAASQTLAVLEEVAQK